MPSTGARTPSSSAAQPVGDRGQQLVGADADLVVPRVGCELLAVQVEDRELAAGAADRDREHHAGVLVEDQGAGRAAAGGRELLADAAAVRAAVSELTRAVTAVRESPVRARSCERVTARPVRTSSSSSPAVAGAAVSRRRCTGRDPLGDCVTEGA